MLAALVLPQWLDSPGFPARRITSHDNITEHIGALTYKWQHVTNSIGTPPLLLMHVLAAFACITVPYGHYVSQISDLKLFAEQAHFAEPCEITQL